VQRDLLTMKALTSVARAICYQLAHAIDMTHACDGDAARHWQDRANLLTPIAKAFATDTGVAVASIGVQVHGGMGFIEETGAASYYRDARIAPIYEGTNGIQAIDLVTRKLPLAGGQHVLGFIAELGESAAAIRTSNLPGFGRAADAIDQAVADLLEATQFLQTAAAEGRSEQALAAATPYLRQFALTVGAASLAKAALASGAPERVALCRFHCDNLLGETAALKQTVIGGSESLLAAGASLVA
jgi:hypothetical protein